MTVNGKETKDEGKTVAALLEARGLDPRHVAVERNGDIMPKRLYESVVLEPGDMLEIVSFVGGG